MSKCRPGELPRRPLAAVVGPTASGKSELALRIARDFGGEIVNFDSIQVYRRFDIGSAKVPPAERLGIPHHLIDIAEPAELLSAGEFARTARAVLREIAGRNRVPVLVGGTGFYLRALLDGLAPAPPRDEALRARLMQRESKRSGSLHRILARLDPDSAVRIHPNDGRKLVRALELCLLRRQPASAMWAVERDALTGFETIKLGLDPPRPALYERVNARVAQMFERGLGDEVRSILAGGIPRSVKPFESLGYSQALAYLDGTLLLEQAIASTQLATRQYAKRQMTWFRREQGVHWLSGFGNDARVQDEAMALVRAHLACVESRLQTSR